MGFHRRCCCAGGLPHDGVCCAPGDQWSPADTGHGAGLTFSITTAQVTFDGGELLLGGWVGPNTILDPSQGSFSNIVFFDDPTFALIGIFNGRSDFVDGCPPLSNVFDADSSDNALPAAADQFDPQTRISMQHVGGDTVNIAVTQLQRFRVAGLASVESEVDGDVLAADVVLDYFIDIRQIVSIQYNMASNLILFQNHRADVIATLNGAQVWADDGLSPTVNANAAISVPLGQTTPAVDVVFDGQTISVEIDSSITIPTNNVKFPFLWSSGNAAGGATALEMNIGGSASVFASMSIDTFASCAGVVLDSPCCTTPPTVSCGYHDAAAPLVEVDADVNVLTYAQRAIPSCSEPPVPTSIIRYHDTRTVQTQQGPSGCQHFVALDQLQHDIPYNWDNIDASECPIVPNDQDPSNRVIEAIYRQSFQDQEGIINGLNGRYGWLAQYEFIRGLWTTPTATIPTTWTIRIWSFRDGSSGPGEVGLSVHARGPAGGNRRWDGIYGDEGTGSQTNIADNTPLSIILAPGGQGHYSASFERDVFASSPINQLPHKYIVSAEMAFVPHAGVFDPCAQIPKIMACGIYIRSFGIGAHSGAPHMVQEFDMSLFLRTPTALTNCSGDSA